MRKNWFTTNGRVLSISKGEIMIYSNDGKIDFEGKKYEILTDLTVMIRALKAEGVIDNDDLAEVMSVALLSREEILQKAKEVINDVADDSEDSDRIFNEIFGDIL